MGQKIKAYITSIGEPTTDLCVWSLERQGFEVILLEDPSTLWDKLNRIYREADDDILRVDADTIVNRNVKEIVKQKDLLWYQGLTFNWHKQDSTHGGIQFIRKEAFPIIREHIDEAIRLNRPESYLFRLEEFHNPRVCGTFEKICGLNGYKQTDIDRVKDVKTSRGQYSQYDWELAAMLDSL